MNKNELKLSEHTKHNTGTESPEAWHIMNKCNESFGISHGCLSQEKWTLNSKESVNSSRNQVTDLCIYRYFNVNKYALPLDIK